MGPEVSGCKRLALFLLCLASFIAVVDTTIVSIALLAPRQDFELCLRQSASVIDFLELGGECL